MYSSENKISITMIQNIKYVPCKDDYPIGSTMEEMMNIDSNSPYLEEMFLDEDNVDVVIKSEITNDLLDRIRCIISYLLILHQNKELNLELPDEINLCRKDIPILDKLDLRFELNPNEPYSINIKEMDEDKLIISPISEDNVKDEITFKELEESLRTDELFVELDHPLDIDKYSKQIFEEIIRER